MPSPDFATFSAGLAAGQGQVLWRERVADLDTPVGAFLKLAQGRPNAFLLESIEGGAARGRYSAIGMEPDLIWRCRNGEAEINRHALAAPHGFEPAGEAALDSLRRLLAANHLPLPPGLPPIAAGLFGYLGYDMVRLMERLPAENPDVLGIPEAVLVRPTLVAVFDHVRDALSLFTTVWPAPGLDVRAAYEAAEARLDEAEAALDRPLPRPAAPVSLPPPPAPSSNFTEAGFMAAVEKAKEYIRAGDCFQVVPSQRFSAPFALPPFALYRALRRINPAPFLFYFDFAGFAAVGASPEILVRLRDGEVTIRPLAGTRRRGATPEEDKALEAELLADPKERAEHLMLLDLGRNDVGRVSAIGSVKVTSQFQIERYSQVMHIGSEVKGRLRPGLTAIDALAGGFPAGTLTGAPKVRAMEIIEELEPSRRGIYAGGFGYFGVDGGMDTCIGLRMALVKDGVMHVQAGAGVVADSDPKAEYEETRQKARALFRAAEEAVRFAAGRK
ncbi:anthranilate synthase component I [Siccirubricoccus sp. KC 17139]|uniref:Anthranilate synthase component 1 n=1 Tax=Siccirubricoccus soli TaxID=2899147 RepID=A0ABT1D0R0_9PROT|nr:anthranilate synthase component I [Siccirubricoccus soli]MCO6415474.1 anthranilate synthase component I [Siccirubricoccus soli]MCP2681606.1 anthranilate synthase component I [Siccirubricoccus soli]